MSNPARVEIATFPPSDAMEAGIEHLDGIPSEDGETIRYYADETRRHYDVDADDVARLGAMLLAGEPDAYSLWCAATDATEVR